MRIANVDLEENKRLLFGLPKIYGIGRSRSLEICQKLNINPMKKIKELTSDEIRRIEKFIEENYKIEGDLRREVQMNIKRLISIGCYRGSRHQKGLPVRGQRTRTNARTRKGPRKTVGSGRKKITKK